MISKKNYYQKDVYLSPNAINYSSKAAVQMYGLVSQEFDGYKTFLDLGCGNAVFTDLVSKRSSLKITGAELSEVSIKHAKELGLNVQKADLQKKFPFKDESFDIIFSGQVIEHLLNPDFFLDECHRILKKNGKLILTTPNLTAWFNRIIFLFGSQPFFTEVSTIDKTIGLSFTKNLTPNREVVGHIRVFTPGSLKDLLQLHKFAPIVHKGYSGGFFPKVMQQVDTLFSHLPPLASNIYIVSLKR